MHDTIVGEVLLNGRGILDAKDAEVLAINLKLQSPDNLLNFILLTCSCV